METFNGFTADQIRAMTEGEFQDFVDGLSNTEKRQLAVFLLDNPEPAPLQEAASGVVDQVGGVIRDVVGLPLLVIGANLVLVGLAAAMIISGLLALLGFKPGDVARLTPPGRAATIAEVAVGRKG